MKSLLLILLTISISTSSNAQIYLTEDINDPEIKALEAKKIDYRVWSDSPFRGTLIKTDLFKKFTQKIVACDELKEKGLDVLPTPPNYNEQKSDLLTYISVGCISFTLGAFVSFALIHK